MTGQILLSAQGIGAGAKYCVTFQKACKRTSALQMSGSHTQDGPKLLLVEDEILIRMVLADDLRMAGYDVLEAIDGETGLALFEANPDIQLVISDIRVPGSIDGIALATIIKQRAPTLPVILASAHLPEGKEGIADKFFHKPYNHTAIIACAGTLLGPAAPDAR